jgi:plastocyanin
MGRLREEQSVQGRIRSAAWAGAAAILLALPGVAEARTKSVTMGVPPKTAEAFQKAGVDVNDFFPHRVTINRGDKIRFIPSGFHSFDLPARGQDPLPLVTPTGNKVAGSNDAAGAPFWFNGQDELGLNPALGPPGTFGKKLSYNGAKRRISGLPLGEDLEPVTVRFKKTGAWTYYCNVHAGMKGVVRVKRKGAAVPSAKADRRAVKRQVARSMKVAERLPKTKTPSGVIDVGVGGPNGEEFFGFVPNAVTVPVGSTLRFRMSPGSYDVHTATTGPGNPEQDPNSYLGQLAASFQGAVFDPRASYQSEPPPSTGTLTPALHGNGFWNSGVMDTTSASPLPESNAVTFGAPGKYDFYCLIHPFMKATVTVQ